MLSTLLSLTSDTALGKLDTFDVAAVSCGAGPGGEGGDDICFVSKVAVPTSSFHRL